jgi:site-specific DNA-methyltransferase (adenine-specific)
MLRKAITANTLFYGDNLDILREYMHDESVDLIYLDPPFNSNRSYNVLFKDESGQESESQIIAFEDTWHWNQAAEAAYHTLVTDTSLGEVIAAMLALTGRSQMGAYLVMMAARLVELHRVLKSTGSLYLHCDPTASHYLKIILDAVFGPQNFRNEIIWQRTSAHSDARRKFADVSDAIFFYSKTDRFFFNVQHIPHTEEYLARDYRFTDEQGRRYRRDNLASPNPRPNLTYEYKGYKPPAYGWRVSREKMEQLDREGRLIFPRTLEGRILLKRYLDEMPGVVVGNIWADIGPINVRAAERLGYPTQKPLALLERIISASSNPGDMVLDPFCGCGTSIAAAQKLGRRWVGIDITHLSIALQKYRLEQMYPGISFAVIGEPEDIGAARQLAQDDRYQFQWWALSLVRARPLGAEAGSKQGKKGSDKGIDGLINFIDDSTGKPKRVLVQVKSGKVKSGDIRDLVGTVQRESAQIGVFITLEEPSRDMNTEATSAGFYESPGWGQKYPRIQILTIAELLKGSEVKMPPPFGTFKQAQRVQQGPEAEQQGLDL